MPDKINEILKMDFSRLPLATELYKEYMGKTKIEEVQEEEYVIDQLMKGRTKKSVIQELGMKYPERKFTLLDLNKFLERNDSFTKELDKQNNQLARRHLNAKVKLEEELAQLYVFTKDLTTKYKEQGDNQSTLMGVRTLSDLIMRFSKLAGFWDDRSSSSSPQNVINIVTDQKADVAKKIIRADFNMVDMNEKNPTIDKEQVENKEGNNK